ncbi:hypothetical protein, partial [Solibacillus kalamii]
MELSNISIVLSTIFRHIPVLCMELSLWGAFSNKLLGCSNIAKNVLIKVGFSNISASCSNKYPICSNKVSECEVSIKNGHVLRDTLILRYLKKDVEPMKEKQT